MLQRQTMIYTELSPNPNSMKFVLNFELAPDGLTFDFPTVAATLEEGKASPLATDLFQFPFVRRIFIASNFITITKDDETEWEDVVYDVKKFMKIFFEQNHPVFAQKTIEKNTFIVDVNDSEIVGKIKIFHFYLYVTFATSDPALLDLVVDEGGLVEPLPGSDGSIHNP